MSLNPKFVTAPSLQQYFVNKNDGFPLQNAKIFFYRDTNRTEPKTVYELQGNQANYTYAPLPNPVRTNNAGQVVDNDGNIIVIYYYPYDADGNLDLYYIIVQDSLGGEQQIIQAWPNPSSSGNATSNEMINYIPNGQLLSHTNLFNNLLVPGSNIIAQGGISIELDDTATSVNTLEFIEQQFTLEPPQSPRYIPNFKCTTANSLEVRKSIRVFFNDVNKFSSGIDVNTYAIWMVATTSIPVSIQVYKFFGIGGSAPVLITQSTATITTSPTFFNFLIDAETNSGFNVGPNEDDYIAIDVSFPTGITFDMSFCDMVLSPGNVPILNFPVQTNADMLARGVAGWMDKPSPVGLDLYLYPMLTRKGMEWDHSVIGCIEMQDKIVPNADDPLATEPIMPANGHSYFYDDNSTIGIPFSRYGDFLIKTSNVPNIPKYGTGLDFATAYSISAEPDEIRLTVNSNGIGIPGASDGNIGWTIGSIVTYNGSTTGSNTLGFVSYNNVADTILNVGQWGIGNYNSAPTAGTTPFTITINDLFTGLTAEQQRSFTVLCTAASTLVAGSGNPGDYWLFSNDTTNYYMWFYFNGETDPTVGSRTGIRVNLESTYTAQDVANIIRETMNAYQISLVNVSSLPLSGQYWLFSANPSLVENFYVWYQVDGIGVDPLIAGRTGIKTSILSSDNNDEISIKTLQAIDKFKFAAPKFNGLFPRGYDPDIDFDLDAAQRFSPFVTGLSGNNLGTFEYQQLLSHIHSVSVYTGSGPNSGLAGGNAPAGPDTSAMNYTGGTETRPGNFNTNFCVRY